MRLTRNQLTKVLIEYGFARFPRIVGDPNQHMVYNFDQVLNFLKMQYGGRPKFISHNSYYDMDEYNNPTNVYFEKTFQDLDTDMGGTVEDAHKDCKKMSEFCKDNKIPHAMCFSGNGFHFYTFMRPKMYTLNRDLSQKIKAVHHYFKQEAGLETPNMVCAEPKRLVRIPFSKYVKKTPNEKGWTRADNYCVPITEHIIHNYNTDEIREYSKNPMVEPRYKVQGNKIYFKDLLKDFGIDSAFTASVPKNEITGESVNYTKIDDKHFYELSKALVPHPCLHTHMWYKNPSHAIRFSACAFLYDVLTRQEAHSFFDKLSHEAQWNDRNNKFIRDYQIDNIYDNGYMKYSCIDLQSMGYCVGNECKYYEKFIKERGNMDIKDEDL